MREKIGETDVSAAAAGARRILLYPVVSISDSLRMCKGAARMSPENVGFVPESDLPVGHPRAAYGDLAGDASWTASRQRQRGVSPP